MTHSFQPNYCLTDSSFCWSVCDAARFDNRFDWLMHLNIQGGIVNKKSDLEILLDNSNISIVCLNEHWLNKESIGILNSIPGYKLASYFCRDNKIHGGSCILLKNNLDYNVREDLSVFNEESVFETTCVEIPNLQIIIISIYRVPNTSNFNIFLDKFRLLLNRLNNKCTDLNNVYIAGDFNVDIYENGNHTRQKLEFTSLIQTYGFQFNFVLPTRIANNTNENVQATESCIDNILSLTLKTEWDRPKMNLELGLSDHKALFISILGSKESGNKPIRTKSKKRIFSNKNISTFNNSLKGIRWDVSFQNCLQNNYINFFSQFQNLFNESFPLKFFKNKPKNCKHGKNWVTQGIKISSVRKRELHRLAKKSCDVNFVNYVKQYKRIFKNVCSQAKQMCNINFINKADNKSKAAWSIVKSELGCDRLASYNFPDIIENEKPLKDPLQIAEFFNKKFTEIAQEIGVQPVASEALKLVQNRQVNNNEKFNFKYVTVAEVLKIINCLKNKSTAGCDEIPVKILKKVSTMIAEPLSIIINQSFNNNHFPNNLKYAEIKPLFKKGKTNISDNYRPVSVLPSFSKIFEKIAFEQMSEFMEHNNIFANEQFGFRKGQNTTNAVMDLVNEISWGLDGSQSTMAVLCDLSKAFDCVNHNILLSKLLLSKFSYNSVLWIQSYLTQRFQRTVIVRNHTKCKSEWKEIVVGVPQGSILGPLLFLLYINDLPSNISSKLILYADDTTAIVKASSDNEMNIKINETLVGLDNWFRFNGLKLNNDKTQLIKFCTSHRRNNEPERTDYDFQGEILTICPDAKFLGIKIDSNLKWNKCTEEVSKKLNSSCYQMLILRNTIDLNTRIMIYYAYFFSILQYGIEIWGMATGAESIFKIQKKFLRIMTFASWRASCKPIFTDLKILTLPSLYILKTLLCVRRHFDTITESQFDHKYNTRFKKNLQYPIHRLQLVEKSPLYMGLRLFNKLPSNLKSLILEKSFKNNLTQYLLEKNYYSVDEFLLQNN